MFLSVLIKRIRDPIDKKRIGFSLYPDFFIYFPDSTLDLALAFLSMSFREGIVAVSVFYDQIFKYTVILPIQYCSVAVFTIHNLTPYVFMLVSELTSQQRS